MSLALLYLRRLVSSKRSKRIFYVILILLVLYSVIYRSVDDKGHEEIVATSSPTAIVTLVTQRNYLLAACILAHSLRKQRTRHPIILLAANLPELCTGLPLEPFDQVICVDPLEAPKLSHTVSRAQSHKSDVFTKLRVWRLTQFSCVLFLDADTIATTNLDSLLDDCDAPVAWVPSLQGMERCGGDAERYVFVDAVEKVEYCQSHSREKYHGTMDLKHSNAGVMVLQPSEETYAELLRIMHAETQYADSCLGRAGCNDQRILNVFCHNHTHKCARLPLKFNVFCDAAEKLYSLTEAAVFHYRGGSKPWTKGEPRLCEWERRDRCGVFIENLKGFIGYNGSFNCESEKEG